MFSIMGTYDFIINSTGSHWRVLSRKMSCLLVKTEGFESLSDKLGAITSLQPRTKETPETKGVSSSLCM